MGYVQWSYETLNHFCQDVFEAFGFGREDSETIKNVLLTADLYGIESHGMQRMVRYHKGIAKGTIHPQAKPEVVFETPVSAVVEGHNGMGQLIGVYGMQKAIEKAKTSGVGIVSVRNSNLRQSWSPPLAERPCSAPIPSRFPCRPSHIHFSLTVLPQ